MQLGANQKFHDSHWLSTFYNTFTQMNFFSSVIKLEKSKVINLKVHYNNLELKVYCMILFLTLLLEFKEFFIFKRRISFFVQD